MFSRKQAKTRDNKGSYLQKVNPKSIISTDFKLPFPWRLDEIEYLFICLLSISISYVNGLIITFIHFLLNSHPYFKRILCIWQLSLLLFISAVLLPAASSINRSHFNKHTHESPEINPHIYGLMIFNKGIQTVQWRKKRLFNMVLGKLKIYTHKNEVGPLSDVTYKINSTMAGGSAGWASSCKGKGCWFNPWSGHMPGLQAWSLGGANARGNRQMDVSLSLRCFFPSLPPSLLCL